MSNLRSASEVAREIKQALKAVGIKARARQENGENIFVTADRSEQAREIAAEVYYRQSHAWMMVQIDGHWLQLAKLKEMESQ